MVDRDEAAVLDPNPNQAPAEADLQQLAMRDHPLLSLDDLAERACRGPSRPMRIKFSSDFIDNLMRIGPGRHAPLTVAGEGARVARGLSSLVALFAAT
jgi:hypothetical protein